MSSGSAKEEVPLGSRIKMKIKFTSQGEGKKKPSSSSGDGGEDHGGEDLVKKELDLEQSRRSPSSGGQSPSSEGQSPNSGHHTSAAAQITPSPSTPSPSPSSVGKRKMKPKQMHDEFLCYSNKKMKKSLSVTKSNNVLSSCAPKSASKQGKSSSNVTQAEVKTRAMIRAEEVQSTLGSEFPSFTKLMVRSHVSNGFWMGIPGQFSRAHLPRVDTTIILEDESGNVFQLKYIAEKMGLSAGWRRFSVENKLVEGDVLIFQLVDTNKFKVHVVRANNLNEVDGALSLLILDSHTGQKDSVDLSENVVEDNSQKVLKVSTNKRRRMKSLRCGTLQKEQKRKPGKSVPKTLELENNLENGYKATDPSSSCSLAFGDVKTFEDFSIMVDELCIDSELPEHIRAKYFDLCFSKNAVLHARLVQGLNSKLIAGIICETVNIADSIKTCTYATSRDEFANWEKTLKSFELLGMVVGFLRARVRKLLELAYESDGALETRQYVNAKLGRVRAEDEIVNLESKIVELKDASEKFDADIEALKSKAEGNELKFQEAVDAPW